MIVNEKINLMSVEEKGQHLLTGAALFFVMPLAF